MDLCLKIQLDTEQQCCILGLAIVIDRPFDNVAGRPVEVAGGWYGPDVAGDLAAAGSLAFTACVGHVAGGTGGLAGQRSVLATHGKLRRRTRKTFFCMSIAGELVIRN
jgi:hypothetical protein